MTLPDIFAMMRRHLIALIIICVIAGVGCLYGLYENPGYQDSAEVAFVNPAHWGTGKAFLNPRSLRTIQEVTGWYLMSAAGQQQVSAAGGTASYNIAFFNANNEEFPNYSEPYVTLTTESSNPAETVSTFDAVMNVMRTHMREQQEEAGASPSLISQLQLISSPTGPIKQGGSHKRTILGYALLTVTALITIIGFLDRRGFRGLRLPLRAS